MQEVLDRIDPEAIARDTLDFIRVRSETGQEGEGSRFLAELLRREGFAPEMDEFLPNRPNVLLRIPGSAADGGRTLLFNGHTDTIPIGVSDPPGRDGDWVIGRGAEDMKGGLVAMVHAASALRRAGVQLGGDLWLTGVVGHETPIGFKEGPLRLVDQLNSGAVQADAIVIVEGPAAVWAASLGSTVFTVTITSDRGAIHTVKVPYVENPACWMGHLLTRFAEWEREFEARPEHPLCGRERVNVGIIRGGDYMNRLPTPLIVSGQRRWLPGQTAADVQGEFDALCHELSARSGLHFETRLEGTREPFETPADHPLVCALRSAGQQTTGAVPDVIGMALVGDANLYANLAGVSTAYYGPAHETAHSDHERVSATRLAECAQIYALAAMEYCGVREGRSEKEDGRRGK